MGFFGEVQEYFGYVTTNFRNSYTFTNNGYIQWIKSSLTESEIKALRLSVSEDCIELCCSDSFKIFRTITRFDF
jgi:hypothetical protein